MNFSHRYPTATCGTQQWSEWQNIRERKAALDGKCPERPLLSRVGPDRSAFCCLHLAMSRCSTSSFLWSRKVAITAVDDRYVCTACVKHRADVRGNPDCDKAQRLVSKPDFDADKKRACCSITGTIHCPSSIVRKRVILAPRLIRR
jgi:hypothetical protein